MEEVLFKEHVNVDEDRVLSLIVSMGSSFPSEVARKLFIGIDATNAIITKLINKELLTRILPDELYPQPLIRCRMLEMKYQGVSTYGQMASRSWVIATEKGFWYIADKFKGQHRRANEAYIETYPNIKYELTQQKN